MVKYICNTFLGLFKLLLLKQSIDLNKTKRSLYMVSIYLSTLYGTMEKYTYSIQNDKQSELSYFKGKDINQLLFDEFK